MGCGTLGRPQRPARGTRIPDRAVTDRSRWSSHARVRMSKSDNIFLPRVAGARCRGRRSFRRSRARVRNPLPAGLVRPLRSKRPRVRSLVAVTVPSAASGPRCGRESPPRPPLPLLTLALAGGNRAAASRSSPSPPMRFDRPRCRARLWPPAARRGPGGRQRRIWRGRSGLRATAAAVAGTERWRRGGAGERPRVGSPSRAGCLRVYDHIFTLVDHGEHWG
jgi:hypothetical protein